MITIKDKVIPYYERFIKREYSLLINDIARISIDSVEEREPEWDYKYIHYFMSKTFFGKKQTFWVCKNDDGTVEFVVLTTNDLNEIRQLYRILNSDFRFMLIKENAQQKLFGTEVPNLYISLLPNPFNQFEYAARIMFGELV